MDYLVYLIPVLLAIGAGASGWMRAAARSFGPLALSGFLIAASAVLCWLIAAQKTGSYLAGLLGTLLAVLMGVAFAGLIGGAVLRGGHEILCRRIKGYPAPGRDAPARPWDVMALSALSVIAVGLSLME